NRVLWASRTAYLHIETTTSVSSPSAHGAPSGSKPLPRRRACTCCTRHCVSSTCACSQRAAPPGLPQHLRRPQHPARVVGQGHRGHGGCGGPCPPPARAVRMLPQERPRPLLVLLRDHVPALRAQE